MQREWIDPRDSRTWLVTLAPFGLGVGPNRPSAVRRERTVAFHRSGQSPLWTRGVDLESFDLIDDQRLMDLLDLASAGRRTGSETQRRWREAVTASVPGSARVS